MKHFQILLSHLSDTIRKVFSFLSGNIFLFNCQEMRLFFSPFNLFKNVIFKTTVQFQIMVSFLYQSLKRVAYLHSIYSKICYFNQKMKNVRQSKEEKKM